jgi:hypothetical protein
MAGYHRCMVAPRLPHPDDLVGVLSNVAHALRPGSTNTLEALRSYEATEFDALFPSPSEPPREVRLRPLVDPAPSRPEHARSHRRGRRHTDGPTEGGRT